MNILGVDPGKSGGLAVINSKTLNIVRGIRMPTYQLRGKAVVSPHGVLAWADSVDIEVAVIEQAHAMPLQGVSSAFSYGRVTGGIEAVVAIMVERMEWVTPSVWKKHFGLGSSKQESIDLAKLKFGSSYGWDKLADEGIAEAALIARWFIDRYNLG
jgi:crossover junction endodeoxyribonuclease RuvC